MTIIDDIKARVDIVDLIQQDPTVKLHRSGKNWTGFCPFHSNSHSPALVVFPDTGTWYCFGSCNEGGSVIDWVLKKNPGYDIKEAIKDLAARANLPLGEIDGPELRQRLAVRAREDAMQIAARLFAKWLVEDPEALAYAKSRGWSDETIAASRLGFSGRSTAAQVKEMKGEFDLHGIKHDSPDAVMILGFRGDVASWAQKHNLDPHSFKEKAVHGLMDKPGLVYAHKIDGRIAYLSRRQLPGHDVIRDQQGGEDREWKSFNPYAALAGEKVPFFNHMHLRDRDRIVIVEGQADAVTLGQWRIPAMALNGSAWKSLDETIHMLKEKYSTIFFATDADTPGELIITGNKNDFPLTTAFGPMLWVARWPKFKWVHNEHEKISKDANDLAQYHLDEAIESKLQNENVKNVFDKAEPIVLLAATYAGRQQGADRDKALEVVLPLIAKMPRNTRNDMRLKLAKAIYPEDLFPEYKGAPIRPFTKLIGDELKDAKKEDDQPLEREETIGGWYPVNEDGTEGYLLEMMYEKQNGKAKFAYAHIWITTTMNGYMHVTSKREIGTAAFVDINGKRYVPMVDDNIRYGTVRLPSALGVKKTTKQLVGEIRLFITRYFLLDNDIDQILASLYALFTWVYDSFPYLPYLRARGAPGTGKSELMLLVGRVCYRMMTTAGLTTIAGFKGMAHIYGGTLMIDEVDSLAGNKEDRGELRALLNVRAMKEQARIVTMVDVLKTDGTHTFRPATTNVFGPTLLTMYGSFKDPATESRCLTFDLFKRDVIELIQKKIEPGVIPPSLEIEADALRHDLLYWRLQTWLPRIEADPKIKLTDLRVSARMNQVMRPLKVLAIMQEDKELLADLNMIAEANYEDEMKRMSESFEALIFRAVVAVDEREEYAKYVQTGKIGRSGEARYVLARDLAVVANEIADVENFGEGASDDKKKDAIKARTISSVCREAFRLPIERAGSHKGVAAIVLDKEKIAIGKFRFGMDKLDLDGAGTNEAKQGEMKI